MNLQTESNGLQLTVKFSGYSAILLLHLFSSPSSLPPCFQIQTAVDDHPKTPVSHTRTIRGTPPRTVTKYLEWGLKEKITLAPQEQCLLSYTVLKNHSVEFWIS